MIKKIFLLLTPFFLIQFFFSPSAEAKLSLEQRLADANDLIHLFEQRYAPFPWKENTLGLSAVTMADRLLQEARDANSDEDLYEAFIHYMSTLQDAHVSWSLPSTRIVRLPLQMEYYPQKLFITEINRDLLPKEHFPFEEGDEVLSVDGVPALEALENLERYVHLGNKLATLKIAALFLSVRPQSIFPFLSENPVELEVYSPQRRAKQKFLLPWKVEGYTLAEQTIPSRDDFQKQSFALASLLPESANPYRKESFFPLWDSFVERKKLPFQTGIFTQDGMSIGYLRLDTWKIERRDRAEKALAALAHELQYLSLHTDALVLDQTNNPGGNTCFVERAAGLFLQEPAPSMLFSLRATRTWLQDFESDLISLEQSDDKELDELKALFRIYTKTIRAALKDGAFLTNAMPLCNPYGEILPYLDRETGEQLTYNKPVVLLVNELSCSGGDMFPALLQDAGRVKVFGENTMGCGGNVVEEQQFGFSELTVRYTASLMVRPKAVQLPSGNMARYIENVGVIPDIPYHLGAEDYQEEFKSYKDAIVEAVKQELKK
ncbi:MAG: hypothetical protein COX62_06180 [Deltaproteobacteria bacterium CG_4_10_14_0_2_um_filter_43_8]|nr:MAG: hypothetical protein COV43_00360 [Deltaproteobacteria bacterium CG11_big_fil_rev_8_21_14_0_20_42_23]PJA19688.1 MAG: hypothetical protein COX62_06180 [Deltaproteobacteria bacterium CG_4_10_14_0_2_um_filter_43_8]PJC64471.1 MAG: hypothetical protein CO021_04265 [Deltaproteobacteria bacterium CG_4_9_14_0_2_um_filter_42_21]